MSTALQRVRVGDVLRLDRRPVEIEPDHEYRLIGVYSFGKGIFHRDPKPGADLGNFRFFEIRSGDLVLSNIQAWEGAIAHADESDVGTIGTHRFLAYVPTDGRIDTNWARYFFLSDVGFPLIERASPGSVTRNRTLAIDRFEGLEIPLPAIEEQRHTAAQLDSTRAQARKAAQQLGNAAVIDRALTESRFDEIVWDNWPTRRLETIAEINPRPSKPDADESMAFVPMSAVDDVTGSVIGADEVPAQQITSGYKQFRRGDVIFARITPCMQNGKTAVFDDPRHRFGIGSTEFHVVRPADGISAPWIHAVLRTRRLRELAADRFTGTAGQQRVPADFLRSVEVPVPHAIEPVLTALARVTEQGLELRRLRKRQLAVAMGLESAILNRAFAGMA